MSKTETPEKEAVETMEQFLTKVENDLNKNESVWTKLEVKSDKDYDNANTVLVNLKGRINRIDDFVEELNAPHEEARKIAVNAKKDNKDRVAEPRGRFEKVYDLIRDGMTTFKREERERIEKERQEAEEKQRKEQEEAERKAKEAKEKGQPAPPPPPVPEPVFVPAPPKTQATDEGKSTVTDIIKSEITDIHALKPEYKKMILEDALKRGHAKTIMDKLVKVHGLDLMKKSKGIRVWKDVQIGVTTN